MEVTPRGVMPIRRAAPLTPAELAAVPSDQHGDALLVLEQAVAAHRAARARAVLKRIAATRAADRDRGAA